MEIEGQFPSPPQSKQEMVEQVIAGLPDVSLRQALEEAARLDPVVWCGYFRRLNGAPLVFDNSSNLTEAALKRARKEAKNEPTYRQDLKSRQLRHRPFLSEPMRDMHPYKAYMKGRQVGVSEAAFNEEVWFLSNNPGRKWIHTFPRDRQLEDFVRTRMDPAFDETPRMHGLLGSPNQAHAKRIGEGFLLIRSAWESNLGEGIDADGVTLDEKDRMRPGVENAFKECLSASKFGFLREVSTPTIPGKGVHETYLKSDQREWHVRCERCGLKQPIEYPDNIVQVKDVQVGSKELPPDSYEFLCRLQKCRGRLNRMRGQWVAKKPGVQNFRGYHMPQTIMPAISATEVMQKKIDSKWLQLWYNYVLGLPAMGESILLNELDYEMACAGHSLMDRRTSDWTDVCVGIDWGHLNWTVVGARNVHNDRRYVIGVAVHEDDHKDELHSVKAVDSFIAPFEPDIIVADAGYGKDRNAYLLRRYGDERFFACLHEKTKVATLDSRGWKYIKDVEPGDFTYAWNGDRVVPTRISHVWDRGVRRTIRIVCKDGKGREKSIVCTGDHVFPMRLGGEKEAQHLLPGDRLVPFKRYSVVRGQYRTVNVTNESSGKDPSVLVYEHKIVCPANVVHHVDGDGCNNVPSNLVGFSSLREHRLHHTKHRPLRMPTSWHAFMAKQRRFGRGLWSAESRKKAVATRHERGWLKRERTDNLENHVVVRIELVGLAPVWDLTVEHEAHNFAIEDGVFVHNCNYNSSPKASRTFTPVWGGEFTNRVLVDRTLTLKTTCRAVKDREIGLPDLAEHPATLLKEHLKNLVPIKKEDEDDTNVIVEEILSKGPDHLAHALGFTLLGFDRLEKSSRYGFGFF